MVNVEAPGYDSGWPQANPEDERWNGLVQDAVKGFISNVESSSRQMAGAAERFASDTAHLIDTVAETVKASTKETQQSAAAASHSAEEARTSANNVNAAVAEASSKIHDQAQAIQAAVEQAERAIRAGEEAVARVEAAMTASEQHAGTSERIAGEVRDHADRAQQHANSAQEASTALQSGLTDALNAADRAERSLSTSREIETSIQGMHSESKASADAATQAASAAKSTADSIMASVNTAREAADKATQAQASSQEALATIQQTAAEAREVSDRLESSTATIYEAVSAVKEAAMAATRAAAEAAQHSAIAQQASVEAAKPNVSSQVLERLEEDYKLIASLVKELYARAASVPVSNVVVPDAPIVTPEPAPMPYVMEPAPAPSMTSEPQTPVVEPQASVPAAQPAKAEPAPEQPQVTEQPQHDFGYSQPSPMSSDWGTVAPAPAANDWASTPPAAEPEPVQPAWTNPYAATTEPEPVAQEPVQQQTPVEHHGAWGAVDSGWPSTAPEPPEAAPTHDAWPPHVAAEPVAPTPITGQAWGGTAEPAPAAQDTWQPLDHIQAQQPAAEPEPEAATAEPGSISGRVVLNISPVPDFDRLLSLDGALGRMNDVRNVSLADYAKEEVTFRIEIDKPVQAEAFARQLSEAASMTVSVVSVAAGSLSLHLA